MHISKYNSFFVEWRPWMFFISANNWINELFADHLYKYCMPLHYWFLRKAVPFFLNITIYNSILRWFHFLICPICYWIGFGIIEWRNIWNLVFLFGCYSTYTHCQPFFPNKFIVWVTGTSSFIFALFFHDLTQTHNRRY